jgi:hypothetical protein
MKRFLSFNHLDILYRDLKEYPDKITYFPQKYHKMFGDEYDVYFPTSGGLAIYSIMKNVKEGQKVDIYGFSFIDNLEDNSHYYDKSCRLTKDHNIDNERQVLKQLTNLKVNLEEEKELVNV